MGDGGEMNERRRKLVPVSAIFAQSITAHTGDVMHIKCTNGLPSDATYIGMTYDHLRDVYFFCYQSTEWEEVPDSEMLPIFTPLFMKLNAAPFLNEAERIIERMYGDSQNKWLEEYRAFKQQTGWPNGD
jgi:hypothetical protein